MDTEIKPLPPPLIRGKPYPQKINHFIGEIKWYVMSKGGQQFFVPDSDSIQNFIFKEYLRVNRNYTPVEIFDAIQHSWLSQPFGQTLEILQIFAEIVPTLFPEEYGYSIQPMKKWCSRCQKVKEIRDFAYSYSAKSKKRRFCKICETLSQSQQLATHVNPELSLEEQRAEILNRLIHPTPSADMLDTIDADPDFSSDRLSALPDEE